MYSLVQPSTKTAQDDGPMVQLPGQEEEPLFCPYAKNKEKTCQQPNECYDQDSSHQGQGAHHGLHPHHVQVPHLHYPSRIIRMTEHKPDDPTQPHQQIDSCQNKSKGGNSCLKLASVRSQYQLHYYGNAGIINLTL